ncbi:MAG: hypothetical protein ABIJ09_10140 [Pseudomonadota bacterium]
MRATYLWLPCILAPALLGCPEDPPPQNDTGWCGVAQAERPACEGTLPTRFDASSTVDKGCYVATQTPRLGNGVTLTLAPGVTILFASGTGLDISADQVLIAAGSVDEPICLSGQASTRGAWDGLRFDGTSSPSQLDHVTVEYGGDTQSDADAAGIKATADSRGVRLTMTHTTVAQSQGWGLFLTGSAVIDGFAANTLTGNALGPASVDGEVVGDLDTASSYTGNDVDQLRVRAYRLSTAATWADLGVPYFLETSLRVETVDWTIAPGVTLIMGSGTALNIDSNAAALIAIGTAEAPILFTGETATRGAWEGLVFDGSNNTRNALSHVIVEWAGNTDSDADSAAVKLMADSRGVQVAISHTTVRQSQGWGLYLTGSAVLPGFEDNVLTENALGPVKSGSTAVQQLLPASTYTGNDVDRVQVHTDYVASGSTWLDLGVPYALDGVLSISVPWILDPGVTLIMQAVTGRIEVNGASASLHAEGTAEKPIVFTAEDATPGAWQGLTFDTTEGQSNVLDHVTVEYAGSAPVQYPGAVFLTSDSRPIHISLTNSTIRHNAAYGVWLCGSAVANSDIESSNSFDDNTLGDYLHD